VVGESTVEFLRFFWPRSYTKGTPYEVHIEPYIISLINYGPDVKDYVVFGTSKNSINTTNIRLLGELDVFQSYWITLQLDSFDSVGTYDLAVNLINDANSMVSIKKQIVSYPPLKPVILPLEENFVGFADTFSSGVKTNQVQVPRIDGLSTEYACWAFLVEPAATQEKRYSDIVQYRMLGSPAKPSDAAAFIMGTPGFAAYGPFSFSLNVILDMTLYLSADSIPGEIVFTSNGGNPDAIISLLARGSKRDDFVLAKKINTTAKIWTKIQFDLAKTILMHNQSFSSTTEIAINISYPDSGPADAYAIDTFILQSPFSSSSVDSTGEYVAETSTVQESQTSFEIMTVQVTTESSSEANSITIQETMESSSESNLRSSESIFSSTSEVTSDLSSSESTYDAEISQSSFGNSIEITAETTSELVHSSATDQVFTENVVPTCICINLNDFNGVSTITISKMTLLLVTLLVLL
jgi:hypothetical protein